ncbi:hypothetical protein, partial [Capnocytophaga gingivalis]
KGTTFFPFYQIFFKIFFSASFITLIFFAGAKVQPFFHSTKSFLKKFFRLFNELRSLIESGCKSTTSFLIDQMFFEIFFDCFLSG